ncbi:MAG: hypothetical protein WC822_06985 [Candidatus Paceibacterota bacterium]|jgi:hypothetical protein
MSNTKIQTTLISLGQITGLANITDNLTETLMGLFRTYIPGIPAQSNYKGLRPVSAEDVKIPCTMIQLVSVDPAMKTTAKYKKIYTFDVWYMVGDDNVEGCVVKSTDMAEIFMKLFSNNALNDQGQAANTNKYKTNGNLWVDSEMSSVEYSVPFLLGRPNSPKYVALGNFQLRIQTVTLV